MLRRVLALVLAVTLALLPSLAYADEVDPFVEQIYLTVTDGSNGQQQKYVKLVENLAGLWYGTVQNGTTTKRQPVVTTGLLGRSLDAFLQQANGDGELAYKWFTLNMQYMDWAVNWQIVDYDADPTANLNMYSTDLMRNYQDWYSYLTGWEPSQGSGGGSGDDGTINVGTISMTVPYFYGPGVGNYTINNVRYNQTSSAANKLPKDFTVTITQEMINRIDLGEGQKVLVIVTNGSSNKVKVGLLKYDSMEVTSYWNTDYPNTYNSCDIEYPKDITITNGVLTYFNEDATITNGALTATNPVFSSTETKSGFTNFVNVSNFGAQITTPTPTPTPVIPVPPLQDEPVVEPYPEKPTNPTITITAPLTIQNESTTTTTDLTPILQAIRILNSNVIEGIETIHNDITQCCETMRTFLDEWANYFGDMLEQIGDRIKGMWYEVTKELIESNSWLQGIYYKLGANGSRPDISNTEEYNNWFNWLIDKALGLLPSDGPAADLVNLFSSLVNVFPFCVPHDLGVILGLFSQSPVTPVVDLPMPTFSMSSGWTTVPVRVDCTPWNDLMGLVRRTQEIVFAFALAMWTRNGLKHFEVDVW